MKGRGLKGGEGLRGRKPPPAGRSFCSRCSLLSTQGRGSRGEEGPWGKPPPDPSGSARHTARPESTAGAQPRHPLVSRATLGLRLQAAWAGALIQSFTAGPSGAESLGVRHVPDPSHAPLYTSSHITKI
ncbi:hypothetical protein NDU88_007705 [Pleurodeles waltl]|uniref:Uncharacterized protein n=1 Tax=Pleurodeles waltl TaxID=8319 RepID=A0AAV7N2Y4_PLEWA|nr:hypothetical protein NDU88_007705 [Pleurodeles waltl]